MRELYQPHLFHNNNMKNNKFIFLALVIALSIIGGVSIVQASPNYCYTASCQPKTCSASQYDCSYSCPQCTIGSLCSATAAGCYKNCCNKPACTYVSSVNTWGPCVDGLSVAGTEKHDVTYSSGSSWNDPVCVDVPIVKSCTVPVATCNTPQDKFKVTQGTAQYTGLDALCKSEYGRNWEFATIKDIDRNYIMTANNGGSMFSNIFVIANQPIHISTDPFIVGSVNYICDIERTAAHNGPLLESGKEAVFDIGRFTPLPLCYSDVPMTSLFSGLCRNTTFNESLPRCSNTSNLSASCYGAPNPASTSTPVTWTATSTGGTGSYTYSWSGTGGLSGGGGSITKTYTTIGTATATVMVTSGTATVSVNCYGSVSAAGGGSSGGGGGSCTSNCGVAIGNIIFPACGTAVGVSSNSKPVSGLCSPDNTASSVVSNSTEWQWSCTGSAQFGAQSCTAPKAPMVSPSLSCSISTNPASPVNINSLVSLTASSTSVCPTCLKDWVITDANGYVTRSDTSSTLNHFFTTIGLKTISLQISSSTAGAVGNPCSTTTLVVSSGGNIKEQ